ncbi:hypothetical protein [Halobaculum limi]|uniref:hypothetical protein n=1 Tax=Halobaculum limi TaxID=3031916 RepID=UPI0024061222|nr:hypothetical protein [Halobaculum sp. YSMS11]
MIIPAGILVFPGFVSRLLETSHKAITFTFVFASLYLVIRLRDDRRFSILFLSLALCIGLTNYVWGIVYGSMLVLFAVGYHRYWIFDHIAVAVIPVSVAVVAPLYLPSISWNINSTVRITRAIRGLQTASPKGAGGTGALQGWPIFSIGGISVNIWFVFVIGIMAISIISLFVGFLVLHRLRMPEVSNLDTGMFGMFLWSSAILIALLAAGNLATLKRVIIIPSILSLLYLSTRISIGSLYNGVSFTKRGQSQIFTVLAIILLISVPLASPRLAPHGDISPYNFYADEANVESIEWIAESSSSCLAADEKLDAYVSGKMYNVNIPVIEPSVNSTQVYDSGGTNQLTCEQDIPKWAYWV